MPPKIDISNERRLTAREVSSLVGAFLTEHPEAFEEWIELEHQEQVVGAIWDRLTEFLKSRCRYKTMTDLTKAALAMRGEIHKRSVATFSESVEARLNLRDGMTVRQASSLDEAVLWCYRHDFHPLAPWPDSRSDPDFDVKVGFALPHLEDYLRLILKDADAIDIPAYARTLYPRMIEEAETVDRYSDGTLRNEGIRAYLARFRSPEFDIDLRDHEISIYPFPPFQIDLEDIVARPVNNLGDDRSEYLVETFQHYFPGVCNAASLVRYPSHDDKLYLLHGAVSSQSLRWFVFSNPAVPSVDKLKWRYGLERWASWAGIMLRPRVEGEVFS